MELIDLLEKKNLIGVNRSYVKYRKIIKTLLDEFNDNELLGAQITKNNDASDTINLITSSLDSIYLECNRTYDENREIITKVELKDDNTKLSIDYEDPFRIKLYSKTNDITKFIKFEELKYSNDQSKIHLTIGIDSNTNDENKNIETSISYTTDTKNIEEMINSIKSTPKYTNETKKIKTLKI